MIKEIMQYIESEFIIINNTPCDICGGHYFASQTMISLNDGMAFDICQCTCENCGHKRQFEFSAPFLIDRNFSKKNNLKSN